MHTGAVHAELSWQGRTGSVSVDGAIVATMRRALLRERAEVDLGSAPWVLATHRGEITAADPAGTVRHVARGEGFWKRRWTLGLAGHPVHLERAGGRRWHLVEPTGTATGEVGASPGGEARAGALGVQQHDARGAHREGLGPPAVAQVQVAQVVR